MPIPFFQNPGTVREAANGDLAPTKPKIRLGNAETTVRAGGGSPMDSLDAARTLHGTRTGAFTELPVVRQSESSVDPKLRLILKPIHSDP